MTEKVSNCAENKENLAYVPYVVSGDIFQLTNDWASDKGYTAPDAAFFDSLRRNFNQKMRTVFPSYEFVSEGELATGLTDLVKASGLNPISLDRVYFRTPDTFDITRVLGKDGQERTPRDGRNVQIGKRFGSPPLREQYQKLVANKQSDVVLVDDVVYSGGLLVDVITFMNRNGIQVTSVIAGIGIKEGIDAIQENCNIPVTCVKEYNAVIDEVCERDFYPGLPLSGRLVPGSETRRIPYLLPLGDFGKWASIPQMSQKSLSDFCYRQTITLFSEIENLSGRQVLCKDLGEQIDGFPNDETRYTDVLQSLVRSGLC